MTKFFRHENGWVNANDVIAIYDVYRKGGSETSKLRTRDDGFLKSNSSGVKLIDNLLPYVPASPQGSTPCPGIRQKRAPGQYQPRPYRRLAG